MSTALGQRTAQSVLRHAARLESLRSGQPLPANIKSLQVRYEGLKGNSGGRHWAKSALPGLIYANPNVKITVERQKKESKYAPVPPLAAATEEGAPVVEIAPIVKDLWKRTPGVFIDFHDSTEQAFFPLTAARSEKLMKRFNDAVATNAGLASLPRGREADSGTFEIKEEEEVEIPLEQTAGTEVPTEVSEDKVVL